MSQHSSRLRRLAYLQSCLQRRQQQQQQRRQHDGGATAAAPPLSGGDAAQRQQFAPSDVRMAGSSASGGTDRSFQPDAAGLRLGLDTLLRPPPAAASLESLSLPGALPSAGVGEIGALQRLAPAVLGGARRLGAVDAFAHMDPQLLCLQCCRIFDVSRASASSQPSYLSHGMVRQHQVLRLCARSGRVCLPAAPSGQANQTTRPHLIHCGPHIGNSTHDTYMRIHLTVFQY
eukprot:SAG25_NODE_1964_length_2086_cov_2.228988_2_plen_231_part_00